MKERLDNLMAEWHEAGRKGFETSYQGLDYDNRYYIKHWKDSGKKYIYLDHGNSGAFILEKETGLVYRLKSKYGVPNKRKIIGHIDMITGMDLHKARWK